MLDREIDPSRRVAALERVSAGEEAPAQVRAMWRIVWSDREPTSLRVACMDRLIARDTETFWAVAATNVPTVRSPGMMVALCDRAVAAEQVKMTGPLIRSLARPSSVMSDAERPEALAIAALLNQSVEEALWAALFSNEGTTVEQAGAWEVQSRMNGADAARAALLARAPSGARASLGAELARLAAVVTPLPHTREQLLWMLHLRRHTPGLLDAPPVRPAALRHLPVLSHADPARVAMSIAEVRERVARLRTGRGFYPRGRDIDGEEYVTSTPERLADHRERLTRADLLHLWAILDALDSPAVRRVLFDGADADFADTEAEHGGLLTWRDGMPVAELYPPALRGNDRAYHSSHRLIEAAYTGMAHFHFHAQQHDNAAFAGPGKGDLGFADRMGMACVVLTFVDRDTLAADYYQPGGVVVDLGAIARPK